MIDLRLLTSLNVAMSDAELLDLIENVATAIEDGNVAADSDLDTITSLRLTEQSRRAWPMTLPATSA
jgi:hypothetical protein